MERAREATKAAIARELALVSIVSRFRYAHRCTLPNGIDAVCLHLPSGPQIWRLLDESESLMFAHLTPAPLDCDDWKGTSKLAVLLDLAVNGWT